MCNLVNAISFTPRNKRAEIPAQEASAPACPPLVGSLLLKQERGKARLGRNTTEVSGIADNRFGVETALAVTTAAGLEAEARRELSQVLGGAKVRPLLMKGNILALSDLPEEKALALIRAAETQYLSRILTVQRRTTVTKDVSCFPAIVEAAACIGRIRPNDLFLVRCTRRGEHEWQGRGLERIVATELERLTGATGEYETEVGWLVSVEVYQNVALIGVNHPSDLIHKVLRCKRKYRPGERPLNRAEWKIKEALREFEIHLGPGARVLDLGAAPGGWTGVLASIASEVVAIDPADLDPRVVALPNVRHVCARADAVDVRQLGEFDLMTCDMNLDPTESAEIMCRLATTLKPGASAIMTIKYMTRQRHRHETDARRTLEGCGFTEIAMKHLPHNGHETTAVMRRQEDEQARGTRTADEGD